MTVPTEVENDVAHHPGTPDGLPVGTPLLDVDGLLDDREVHVIVCCGSGGVGKTTTAAALALRAADGPVEIVSDNRGFTVRPITLACASGTPWSGDG